MATTLIAVARHICNIMYHFRFFYPPRCFLSLDTSPLASRDLLLLLFVFAVLLLSSLTRTLHTPLDICLGSNRNQIIVRKVQLQERQKREVLGNTTQERKGKGKRQPRSKLTTSRLPGSLTTDSLRGGVGTRRSCKRMTTRMGRRRTSSARGCRTLPGMGRVP